MSAESQPSPESPLGSETDFATLTIAELSLLGRGFMRTISAIQMRSVFEIQYPDETLPEHLRDL